MKRSQPKRDWREARAKVDAEGACRLFNGWGGACQGKIEAAHIIGREHDKHQPVWIGSNTWGATPLNVLYVVPERIVPLCQRHHRAYDAHELDLLQSLTVGEQLQAVADAGSLESARRRLAPSLYRQERETDAA